MLPHRITRWSAILVVAVLAATSARAQWASAPANEGDLRSRDHIRVEVKGRFGKAAGAGAEHTGFQISANGVTWEVDASANKALLRRAALLDGKLVIATGTYAEQQGVSRSRRILTAEVLRAQPEEGRGEYIAVTMLGTLKTGVIAIGAETTGVTITSNAVTWDLDLDRNQRQVANKLNDSRVVISGRLGLEGGVEIKNRFVVKVRKIKVAR